PTVCSKKLRKGWLRTVRSLGGTEMRRTTSLQIGRPSFPRFAQVRHSVLFQLLLILAIPILLGGFLAACGGGGSGGPPPSNLQSLTIDPVNPLIAVGTNVQLHATGTFKNRTTKDLTQSVTWLSGDTTVANVTNTPGTKGLASGAGSGLTTIKVKFKGKKGFTAFGVTKATLQSITIDPVNPVIAKSTTVQLSAFGNFSDGSSQDLTNLVSWSSGNGGVAQVSNTSPTKGLVTGQTAGSAPITAAFNGTQGSTTVTVSAATVSSITITPAKSHSRQGHQGAADRDLQLKRWHNPGLHESGGVDFGQQFDRVGQYRIRDGGAGHGRGRGQHHNNRDPRRRIGLDHGYSERRDLEL